MKRIDLCTIITNDSDTDRQTIAWDPEDLHLYSDREDGPIDGEFATYQTVEDAEDACAAMWGGSNSAWDLQWIEREDIPTIWEFVSDLMDNCPDYPPEEMSVETAAADIENFTAEGWTLPDGLTPETYAATWNEMRRERSED